MLHLNYDSVLIYPGVSSIEYSGSIFWVNVQWLELLYNFYINLSYFLFQVWILEIWDVWAEA